MTRTRGQRALQERLFTALAAADGRFTMPAAIAALCAAPASSRSSIVLPMQQAAPSWTTLHWAIALDVPSAVAPLVAGGAALNAVLQPPSVLFMTALPDWLAAAGTAPVDQGCCGALVGHDGAGGGLPVRACVCLGGDGVCVGGWVGGCVCVWGGG